MTSITATKQANKKVKLGTYSLACVASVSVRFRSKERGTTVKDRAKNGASVSFFGSFHFSRGQNRESRFFLFCETKRKRLLRRLLIPTFNQIEQNRITKVDSFNIKRVFAHVASIYANLLEQKKVFA